MMPPSRSHTTPRRPALLLVLGLCTGLTWSIGRRARRRLSEMARTDLLTGVANRRALHELLDREMARAARAGTLLSLAMVDADDALYRAKAAGKNRVELAA